MDRRTFLKAVGFGAAATVLAPVARIPAPAPAVAAPVPVRFSHVDPRPIGKLATWIPVTNELLEDRPALEAYLGKRIRETMVDHEGFVMNMTLVRVDG